MRKEVYANANEVASIAALDVIATLSKAIREKGKASWVLAGGSSPMAAYKNIVSTHAGSIDWSKVTVLMGDERCVPLDHDDSNWGQISNILFTNELISACRQLVPRADLGAVKGAELYSQQVRSSLTNNKGELDIDLLWLGVGEDGHTLSLFPNHPGLEDDSDIVIPIHDSPKPPSDRISLSLNSAALASKIVIFAVGASKRDALMQAENNTETVPVGTLAKKADALGSEVLWLYDEPAAV